jgi:hypothetical protein
MFQALSALGGATGGGSGMGLSASSTASAEASSGPVTVGGFTFSPNSTNGTSNALILGGAILVAALLLTAGKRKRGK